MYTHRRLYECMNKILGKILNESILQNEYTHCGDNFKRPVSGFFFHKNFNFFVLFLEFLYFCPRSGQGTVRQNLHVFQKTIKSIIYPSLLSTPKNTCAVKKTYRENILNVMNYVSFDVLLFGAFE